MFQGKRCESRRNVERVAAEWRFESQPCATTVLPFLLHHLMVFSIESCGGIAVSKMLGPGNSRPKNWIVVNVDKLLFPALSGLWWIIHPYRWMYCPTQKKHICYIKLLDTPPELLVSAVAGLQQQWTYALDAFLTQRMMSTYLEKLFGPYVSYLLKWPLTKTDSKQPSNVLVINFPKKKTLGQNTWSSWSLPSIPLHHSNLAWNLNMLISGWQGIFFCKGPFSASIYNHDSVTPQFLWIFPPIPHDHPGPLSQAFKAASSRWSNGDPTIFFWAEKCQ